MQHKVSTGSMISRVAKKEVTLFFASPIAYLFLAVFAVVTLFVFFWVEAFFSRNIADVRPLFEWMPLLLIFLASALTMRLWSEERRTGTLEYVLTQPASLWHFVVGKFFGCLVLLLIALAITLPLPITVSVLGDLDWGPVAAGYLASFLLGATYLSIGLFVSARTQNQIVSLIISVAVCAVFYLIGAKTLTKFVGYEIGEWLRLAGTGSRFDAITRGVIDFRDLYYYLSIVIVFLALNTYSLEKERWASGFAKPRHTTWRTVTVLLMINAIAVNLWLGQINSLRIDTTQGNQYTISGATENYLKQLREPLLVRGYFSSKTHPLLSPLVPQLRDLIREYEIAGGGKVRVEFIDPAENPDLEQEANQKYGIQPVPFQMADRYQSSIVSSYFDILIKYGDQHETLGFGDFIEVKASGSSDIDVQLRNPEHDITRAIKKVLKSYQAGGNLFDTIDGDVVFNAYVSDDAVLPEELKAFKKVVQEIVEAKESESSGRLKFSMLDPNADGAILAQEIAQQFGFQPMATSLFSNDAFYFYLTLQQADQVVQIPLEDMTKESFERNFDAALKRFASGFTKTVALVKPETNPQMAQFGMAGAQFNQLEQFLGAELNVQTEDLSDGRVSGDSDILLVVSPKDLDEKQVFAIDQFLMQGGTVVLATSPYSASMSRQRLSLEEHSSGIESWLIHHGLSIDKKIVMDRQNASFPVPVSRNVGGFSVQEVRMIDYPYFVDIRDTGLNENSVITSDIPQLTFAWSSPINVDSEKNADRKVTELIHSSDGAWLSSSTDIMPKIDGGNISPYQPQGEQGRQLLGVISEGTFDSFFAGKESPLLAQTNGKSDAEDLAVNGSEDENDSEDEKEVEFELSSVIAKSADSARIVVYSSNDFLRDQVNGMLGSAVGTQYLNTLQLAANTIDWSLEDASLLSIRSRGHFNRTLPPLEQDTRAFWEYLNYFLAAFAIVCVALLQRVRKNIRRRQYQQLAVA